MGVAPGREPPALVVREPERAQLAAFARGVGAGACALVLRGEPGIGKTTLWRFGIRACRAAGVEVRRTRPAEEEMAVPGVALADLFDEEPPGGADAQDDAFAGGRAVLEALRDLATDRPTVLA